MMRRLFLCAVLAMTGPALAETTLRFVPNADLVVLDPNTSSATTTLMHAQLVYETLFALDSHQQPKPEMVDRYTISPDKLEYRFTLRPSLRFHDGQPVTSDDVVPSLLRWMVRDTLGQKLKENLATLEPDGPTTIVMHLAKPFPFVEMALATAVGTQPVIMRRQDALTDPFKNVTTAIGSGPFRFVSAEWQPGVRAVYQRNADYVPRPEPPDGLAGGRVVKVDRVEMVWLPDASTRASALRAGEIDLIDQLPQDLIELVQSFPGVAVQGLAPTEFQAYIRPNHLFPPFNTPKGLEALAYLVKQSDYMSGYGPPNWWRECYSFFICGTANGTDAGSASYHEKDLAKAKQLFAEAGYKGEKIVVIAAADNPVQKGLADVTVGALRSIGVNVDYQIMDFGTALARRNQKKPPSEGGWNLYHSAVNGSILTSPLTNLVIDSTCGGKNYFGWPCDVLTEQLRAEYQNAPDESTRQVVLRHLSERLWQTYPVVLLGQYIQPYAWRSNVTGLLHTFPLAFWNVEKK